MTTNSEHKMKIIFILNPISGAKNKDGVPMLIDKCLDREKYDYEIIETLRAGHASEIARQAAKDGVDIVVAIGGDGTVNEVARAITGTRTAMAIIPYGSGNGLARHLMLPMNIRGAIDVINAGVIHDLDYGVLNGMPFFCTCGMGFDAFISQEFALAGKRGPLTYLEKVLKEGFQYKPETYIVEDETGQHTYNAFLISIANASQYGNNAYIAPQASMSDGFMDVIIMSPFDAVQAAQVGYDMMNKTLDKNTCIKTFKTKHIHIRRENPGVVHYDGEPIITDKDIDVSIREKGIRIVVNPNADKRKRRPNKAQTTMNALFNEIHEMRSSVVEELKSTTEEAIEETSKTLKTISSTIQNQLSK